MVILGQTKSTMSTINPQTKGIIVLIENDKEIADDIKSDLETSRYEVLWINSIGELYRFYTDMEKWPDERLGLLRAVVFDFYFEEDEEEVTTLPFIPDFLRVRGLRSRILLANSLLDDRNEELVRNGCMHSRPRGTAKNSIAHYLIPELEKLA